jgi:mRNA interferase MazF
MHDAAVAALVGVIDRRRRAAVGEAIADGYRRLPVTDDEASWPDAASARDDRRGAVVSNPLQRDVWWAQAGDKRRPVLIVTRTDAIAVLNRIVVAPLTRTVRSIPTEIRFGPDDGLATECAASFDNLRPLSRSLLTERIAMLGLTRRHEICGALEAFADC